MPPLIDRLAPNATPTPTPAQTPAPAAGAAPTPETPTKQEQALAAAAPTDQQAANSIVYEVEIGGEKRKLTPQQIASTYERYRELNFDQAQLRPGIDLLKTLQQKTGLKAGELANVIVGALRNQTKTPAAAPAQPEVDDEATFKKWEEENAASLPPGYREFRKTMAEMAKGQQQIQTMLTNILNAGSGITDAAKAAHMDARSQRIDAIKRTIANNLSQAQQKFQLPDEAANDFMTFAAERGFTTEDFVDPGLTQRVAQDFAATRNTPEFERLKQIAAKRQAFTGSLGSVPNAGPATGGDAQDTPLARLTNKAMSQRGMG